MADDAPKTRSVKLTNTGQGGRTFFDADRTQHALRPGETFEGEILEADYNDLSPDLTGDENPDANAFSAMDFPKLDGLNKAQLLEVATREGYSTMAADAEEDEIRKSIEEARKSNPMVAEVQALQGKSRKALLDAAKKDGVAVETDDNQGDLVRKIAEARVAKASG
jgi:hypothetical protein